MFTQLVMWFSMVCLVIAGVNIFQRAKSSRYVPGQFLAVGLFLVGFAILLYAIRDIFIQFGRYDIQYLLYQAGVISQSAGGLCVFVFIYKEFAPKIMIWLTSPIIVGGAFLIMLAVIFLPTLSLEKEALLEPISYRVINHPWELRAMNIAFLIIMLTFSFSVFSIFAYRTIKIKGRRAKIKGLLYGAGIFLLYIPTLLGVFVSPIFARIGYGIGAILVYKAFGMKV